VWSSSNSAVQLTGINTPLVSVSMNSAPVVFQLYVTGINAAGCTRIDSTEIEVIDFAGADNFFINDTVISIGDTVRVSLQDDPRLRYNWSPAIDINCINCVSVELSPLSTTTYTAQISDIYGCPSQSSNFTIFVIEQQSVDLPDAFSPNGDGINDVIYPDGLGIERIVSFEVYNRYGQLVHKAEQLEGQNRILDIGWDGTFKGKKQAVDVYNYIVVVKYYNIEKPFVERGAFRLIK
jgi:gliding motility-associated-like protein